MFIKKIKIENFRNIKNAEILFSEKTNVIYGDNGQGKTNFIEAIWIFSGNQSFRGSKISEYKKFDEEFLRNEIIFCDSQRDNKAEFVFGNKKYVKLNNVMLTSISEMNENFYCVVFSPFLLSFVQGNPKNRRKFLDIAISQINYQYKSYLSTYEKILEQRNALLKTKSSINFIKENIDAWDMQLAKVGTIISIFRNDYIKKLELFASKIFNQMSNEKEEFSLSYFSTVFEDIKKITVYEEEYYNDYYKKLKENFENDIKYGSTTIGIHRDDLLIFVKGISAKTFGSQGQQRSAVISIKLAESMIIKKITGQQPIMLLDDVLSELDEKRQDYLLNHIKDCQVFITCCDKKNFLKLNNGKFIHIENGAIISQEDVEKK